MTPQKRRILDFIEDFESQNRYSPSIPEIAKQFDIALSTVWQHLNELKKMGLIAHRKNKRRDLEVLYI